MIPNQTSKIIYIQTKKCHNKIKCQFSSHLQPSEIEAYFVKNKKRKQLILFQDPMIGFCDNSHVTKVPNAFLNLVICEYKLQDLMERCTFIS